MMDDSEMLMANNIIEDVDTGDITNDMAQARWSRGKLEANFSSATNDLSNKTISLFFFMIY